MQRGNNFYGSDISKVSALRNFPRAPRRPTVKGDIQLFGIGIPWKNMMMPTSMSSLTTASWLKRSFVSQVQLPQHSTSSTALCILVLNRDLKSHVSGKKIHRLLTHLEQIWRCSAPRFYVFKLSTFFSLSTTSTLPSFSKYFVDGVVKKWPEKL